MRWDNLFDDLESQLEQEIGAEELDLQAEEERLRLGRLSMRDRLRAIHQTGDQEHPIRLALTSGENLAVCPSTIGKDWISGELHDESSQRTQCILPLDAIASLSLTRTQVRQSLRVTDAADSTPGLATRLGLAFVIRDLCRRRRAVDLHLAAGHLHGTIDRVGREHFDLAVHEKGAARRETAVTGYRVVPFNQLLLVRL